MHAIIKNHMRLLYGVLGLTGGSALACPPHQQVTVDGWCTSVAQPFTLPNYVRSAGSWGATHWVWGRHQEANILLHMDSETGHLEKLHPPGSRWYVLEQLEPLTVIGDDHVYHWIDNAWTPIAKGSDDLKFSDWTGELTRHDGQGQLAVRRNNTWTDFPTLPGKISALFPWKDQVVFCGSAETPCHTAALGDAQWVPSNVTLPHEYATVRPTETGVFAEAYADGGFRYWQLSDEGTFEPITPERGSVTIDRWGLYTTSRTEHHIYDGTRWVSHPGKPTVRVDTDRWLWGGPLPTVSATAPAPFGSIRDAVANSHLTVAGTKRLFTVDRDLRVRQEASPSEVDNDQIFGDSESGVFLIQREEEKRTGWWRASPKQPWKNVGEFPAVLELPAFDDLVGVWFGEALWLFGPNGAASWSPTAGFVVQETPVLAEEGHATDTHLFLAGTEATAWFDGREWTTTPWMWTGRRKEVPARCIASHPDHVSYVTPIGGFPRDSLVSLGPDREPTHTQGPSVSLWECTAMSLPDGRAMQIGRERVVWTVDDERWHLGPILPDGRKSTSVLLLSDGRYLLVADELMILDAGRTRIDVPAFPTTVKEDRRRLRALKMGQPVRTDGRFELSQTPPSDLHPPADATSLPSGVQIQVLKRDFQEDQPDLRSSVKLRWVSWNEAGQVVDQHLDEPLISPVHQLAPGRFEATRMMARGDVVRVFLPEGLDPNEARVVDLELVDVRTEVVFDSDSRTPPATLLDPPADAIRLPSGLAYRVLHTGPGGQRPTLDDVVTLHATGWTADGRSLTKRDPDKPMTFPLSQAMAGWKEALPKMQRGDRIRLWVPEALAYPGTTRGPKGDLVFDLLLLDVTRP